MDQIPDRIDSRFRFVLLAAARAEQMMRGAAPKVDVGQAKVTRLAMQEIVGDLVEWDYGPAPQAAPAPAVAGTEEA
jgi:DNA-directed RNA polymerase omega subunit